MHESVAAFLIKSLLGRLFRAIRNFVIGEGFLSLPMSVLGKRYQWKAQNHISDKHPNQKLSYADVVRNRT